MNNEPHYVAVCPSCGAKLEENEISLQKNFDFHEEVGKIIPVWEVKSRCCGEYIEEILDDNIFNEED